MITKRANVQFVRILDAARGHGLCVAECSNIKTGKKEYVLCAHSLSPNGVIQYEPLAKLFQGNPYNEITPPGAAPYKLI